MRELRLAAKQSQETLSAMAEIHTNYLGGLERGERNIGALNLYRLADALNITIAQLLDFENPRPEIDGPVPPPKPPKVKKRKRTKQARTVR